MSAFNKEKLTPAAGTGYNSKFDKAQGFANLLVQTADGSFVQVSGAPMRLSNAIQAAILEMSPEEVEELVFKIEIRKVSEEPKTFAFAKKAH
jgi:hypothetical protein